MKRTGKFEMGLYGDIPAYRSSQVDTVVVCGSLDFMKPFTSRFACYHKNVFVGYSWDSPPGHGYD
jgi:hypothetical protein